VNKWLCESQRDANALIKGPTDVSTTKKTYVRDDETISSNSIVNSIIQIYGGCGSCVPPQSPSPTPTPTTTPTPTITPTKTSTPTPTPTIGYYTYSLGTGATFTDACNDFGSAPNTIYGTVAGGPGPNTGEFLYFNTGLTIPVANGYYSNGVGWYEVTGGAGEITSAAPAGC
jgi:hypothetical protein